MSGGPVPVGRELWGRTAEEVVAARLGGGRCCCRSCQAKPGSKPSLQARLVAVTLADQAGRAFGVQARAGR